MQGIIAFFLRLGDIEIAEKPTPFLFKKAHSKLDDVLTDITPIVPNLNDYFKKALEFAKETKDNFNLKLSIEVIAALHLYTMEWNSSNESFYYKLNQKLRSTHEEDNDMVMGYVQFLWDAKSQLEEYRYTANTVWRCTGKDMSDNYKQDECYFWWGFSSCSADRLVAEKWETDTPIKTLFEIELTSGGYDLALFSKYPEKEVLLFPGFYFAVLGVFRTRPLITIKIRQISPPFIPVQRVIEENTDNMLMTVPRNTNMKIIETPKGFQFLNCEVRLRNIYSRCTVRIYYQKINQKIQVHPVIIIDLGTEGIICNRKLYDLLVFHCLKSGIQITLAKYKSDFGVFSIWEGNLPKFYDVIIFPFDIQMRNITQLINEDNKRLYFNKKKAQTKDITNCCFFVRRFLKVTDKEIYALNFDCGLAKVIHSNNWFGGNLQSWALWLKDYPSILTGVSERLLGSLEGHQCKDDLDLNDFRQFEEDEFLI